MSLTVILMTPIQNNLLIQCLFCVTLFLIDGETKWVKTCSLYEVAPSLLGHRTWRENCILVWWIQSRYHDRTNCSVKFS